MTEQDYRDNIKQRIVDNQNDLDFYRTSNLELTKRQLGLGIDWMMSLSTLCFAIGAAVVPLISQFSRNSIAHPNLLLLAAIVLILNGSAMLLIRKHRMEEETRMVNTLTMPHQISLMKTRAVLLDYYQGHASKADVDKRQAEQLSEAEEISNKPRAKDSAIPELDVYLGVMLLGIVCIFASIIHNHRKLGVYIHIVAVGAVLYMLYMMRSYTENRKNIAEKEALDKDLNEAEEYKVTT
ncbi:MAG: hypothetical protein JWN38_1091 [Candidatus Saccharibacteria bacterium]|nr:hypothetical protein [Candidatus Saccharibacteria bacterium]